MRFIEEFRDGSVARQVAAQIAAEASADREYKIMEFCGGHTHSLCRYGLIELLPKNVEMIHGPGCPVCVLPIGRLDQAIALARQPNVMLCAYGDMMRVPGKDRVSLMRARAQGANVKMVFGANDALKLARANPDKQVVFFAIGFETTTPPTALAVKTAQAEGLENFTVFVNHVLTPSAIEAILGSPEAQEGRIRVDGFVGPGHVSTIIGTQPYDRFARDWKKPIAVSGFEPLDLLQSILMIVRQLNDGRHEVENQYSRAVNSVGNLKAQRLTEETMELRPSFEWRGLGTLQASALKLRPEFAKWDAEARFTMPYEAVADHKACACGDILKGLKKPTDCKIFATACTPESPIGSCMVSPEGSCAAYYLYGRHRTSPTPEPERRTA
ncbi:MAG: hydrogenase formation protein HypD [Archangiaceae bacterium]|nr:hydrogenase formation protein HypD [Archangiaceae bacterium]